MKNSISDFMGTYFNSIFREGVGDEMTFEQRPVGNKE